MIISPLCFVYLWMYVLYINDHGFKPTYIDTYHLDNEFDFENGEWEFDRVDLKYIFCGPVTITITCMLMPEQDPFVLASRFFIWMVLPLLSHHLWSR